MLRLHQLVIAPNEARLGRHQGSTVWSEVADTVSARIYGSHYEILCRTWRAEHAPAATLGGAPGDVAPTEIACREHAKNHEVDVLVTEIRSGTARRVTAICEAKWRTGSVGSAQLLRLEHLRDLLEAPEAKLLLFSRSGFGGASRTGAGRTDVEPVDLDRLYTGS